ncbi:NTF2- export protein 1 [Chamberlinius hualienensis]
MDSYGQSRDLVSFDEACKAAEKFCSLYYDNFDKQRHKLGMFYMDDAALVWNGNGVSGKPAVVTFYENLPTTKTDVRSLDAQPITVVEGNERSILVNVFGYCQYGKKPATQFCQTFRLCVVTSENSASWKIAHDNFRLFK